MPLRQEVFGDRRFWASLYLRAFGQIGEQPEPELLCSLLQLNERDAQDWDNKFTGWYPGILDESDGYSDDPATVQSALANGVQLRVELHPCDQCWFLRSEGSPDLMLANTGPHWSLPGLRWPEVVAIASAVPSDDWIVVLLLLPVVWLTAGDDAVQARVTVESAWLASNLIPPASASALADLWVKAVEGGRDFRWRQTSESWLCDAEWSTRSEGGSDAASLNRIVAAAGSTAFYDPESVKGE
jgi:hypothetical protein